MASDLMRKNELMRNVLTLMTGTTISQAIPIAAMPVLTRLYSPEDFGILAFYVAIISILSVAITAHYETAVMLPADDADSASIVVLGSSIALFISLCMATCVYLFGDQIALLLGMEELRPFLYLVPITTAFMGIYQSLNAWGARKKSFKQLAICRVTESGTTAASQILLHGAVQAGGQIYGNFIGKVAASTTLARMLVRVDKDTFRTVTKSRMYKNAIRYKDFPLFRVGGSLLDTTAAQLPAILMARFFGAGALGFFSLTLRVLSLPITFVSSSLSQVLYQRIVELSAQNPLALRVFVVRAFFLLLLVILPLPIIMWYFGTDLFVLVFGEAWRLAGEQAFVVSIAVSARFAVSPLSVVLNLQSNVRMGAAWQALYFVTMLLTLSVFGSQSAEVFIMAFAIHEIVLYLIYFVLILIGTQRAVRSGDATQ